MWVVIVEHVYQCLVGFFDRNCLALLHDSVGGQFDADGTSLTEFNILEVKEIRTNFEWHYTFWDPPYNGNLFV